MKISELIKCLAIILDKEGNLITNINSIETKVAREFDLKNGCYLREDKMRDK